MRHWSQVAGLLVLTSFQISAAQRSEIRVAGTLFTARRNVALDSIPAQTSGTISGGEFLARGHDGGVMLRYSQVSFGPRLATAGYSSLTVADGRVFLGPQVFAVELGFMRRATSIGLFKDPAENLGLVGARSVIGLGPSGFTISFAGQALGRIDKDTVGFTIPRNKVRIAGWSVETGLTYQAPRKLPFFGMLGYRFERFKRPTLEGATREETSSVVLAVGLRWVKF